MIYETSKPFRGDSTKAIQFLAATLTGAGFRIESTTDTSLIMTRPGILNTRNPLSAASRVEFHVSGGSILAKSELKIPSRIIRVVAATEAVFLGFMFFVLFAKSRGTPHVGLPLTARFAMFLPPFVVVVLIPVIVYTAGRSQYRKSLDTLVHNAANMYA